METYADPGSTDKASPAPCRAAHVASNCDTSSEPSLQDLLAVLAAISELVAQIESADDVTAAGQILADQVQRFLSAEKVLVGLCRERTIECRLLAVSGERFDPRGELAVVAQGALQEAIAHDALVQWPPTSDRHRGGLLAHAEFADESNVSSIVSSPLRDAQGHLRGAWLVAGRSAPIAADRTVRFMRTAELAVASAVGVMQRAEKGRVQRALYEMRDFVRGKRGKSTFVVLALLAIFLCLPVPYRPRCECTVEPATRRYVAAPFAGPLAKSLVEPGDIVEQGQLLARMDGRELKMELSATRADLHRVSKQRAGHLANLHSGEAEVARFEVDRLVARTELLEHRERNIEIVSPLTGIVVSGDHHDAEGMPLEMGQTLFEISPLEDMIVEISIAEDDFAYIRPGMATAIRLEAFPFRRFSATIESVHPRAELRDNRNVFVAKVRLEHIGLALRPGMRGSARLAADRFPLAWILCRRPLAAVVAWLGW